MNIWECKIGEVPSGQLAKAADLPMRQAVARAYREITGEEPRFIFSGWGARLTDAERAVVDKDDQIPVSLKTVERSKEKT